MIILRTVKLNSLDGSFCSVLRSDVRMSSDLFLCVQKIRMKIVGKILLKDLTRFYTTHLHTHTTNQQHFPYFYGVKVIESLF